MLTLPYIVILLTLRLQLPFFCCFCNDNNVGSFRSKGKCYSFTDTSTCARNNGALFLSLIIPPIIAIALSIYAILPR